ncbi:MAG: hypothetical protein ACKOI0_02080 [Actinomycetota bacterium]
MSKRCPAGEAPDQPRDALALLVGEIGEGLRPEDLVTARDDAERRLPLRFLVLVGPAPGARHVLFHDRRGKLLGLGCRAADAVARHRELEFHTEIRRPVEPLSERRIEDLAVLGPPDEAGATRPVELVAITDIDEYRGAGEDEDAPGTDLEPARAEETAEPDEPIDGVRTRHRRRPPRGARRPAAGRRGP